MVLLNHAQNVVDVDVELTNRIHFENDVIVDVFRFTLVLPSQLVVEVEIQALVVLKVVIAEDLLHGLVIGEFIENPQHVQPPQDFAKEHHELLDACLSGDGNAKRILLLKFRD